MLKVNELIPIQIQDRDVPEDLRHVIRQLAEQVVLEIHLLQLGELADVGHQIALDGRNTLL